jgi:phage tail sheath protein FI
MQRRGSLGILDKHTLSGGVSDRCQICAMTQEDINNGPLVCLIGIAPVKPADFVIFRIQQV